MANAILLPYVLESFGSKIYKRLALLSDALNLTDASSSVTLKGQAFISYIKTLNQKLDIPDKFSGVYEEKDISELALHAVKEANPLYPVPVIKDQEELAQIYRQALAK